MINRFFYKSSLYNFISDSTDTIFVKISRNDEGDSVKEQKYAWSEEIEIMQEVLFPWRDENGEIFTPKSEYFKRLKKNLENIKYFYDY